MAGKAYPGILGKEYREQRASVSNAGRDSTADVRVGPLYCKIELENKINNIAMVYNIDLPGAAWS